MIAVGDVQRTPSAQPALVTMVEILEPMKIMEIPEDRGMFAIDLQRVERLVTAGVTRRFERGQRAVAESGEEGAGVVDRDFFDLAGEIVLAFRDEGLGHAGHRLNRAVEPHCGVDAMREQVAGYAAPGHIGVEPP